MAVALALKIAESFPVSLSDAERIAVAVQAMGLSWPDIELLLSTLAAYPKRAADVSDVLARIIADVER